MPQNVWQKYFHPQDAAFISLDTSSKRELWLTYSSDIYLTICFMIVPLTFQISATELQNISNKYIW